jgi:predicted O-methyltransferase YrrM
MMSEFFEITDLKWGPIQYYLNGYRNSNDNEIIENYCIAMSNHMFPLSVRCDEFEFLKNLIIKYNLKSGFELATAFGVSAVALGTGFKQTGGKLLTMDAYIEETSETYDPEYPGATTNYDADGFKSVNYLIEHFRLKDVVNPQIGWSPVDVKKVVESHSRKTFDFLFLDGGHSPEQIIRDLYAIRPFLEKEYIIVLHDYYENVYTEEVNLVVDKLFGIQPIIELSNPFGDNLAVIYNKKIGQ